MVLRLLNLEIKGHLLSREQAEARACAEGKEGFQGIHMYFVWGVYLFREALNRLKINSERPMKKLRIKPSASISYPATNLGTISV